MEVKIMLCEYKNQVSSVPVNIDKNKQNLLSHTYKHPVKGYHLENWHLHIKEDISSLKENDIDKLSKVSNQYLEIIKKIIEKDFYNPTNVSYTRVEYGNSKFFITIIDENGFSVILEKLKDSYLLKTCFGSNDKDQQHFGESTLQFARLLPESSLRKLNARRTWEFKFQNKKKYKNICKEILENW